MEKLEIQNLIQKALIAERRRQFKKKLFIIAGAAIFVPALIYAASVTIPNTFSDGETLSAAKLNENFSALANASSIPAGTIVAFGGSTPPSGWLLCDGSQVSRSTYSALYAATGNAYGAGDGTSSFHLPDLRGRFLRGVDGTANIDPNKATRTAANAGGNTGNNIGSSQTDAFQSFSIGTTTMDGNSLVIGGTSYKMPAQNAVNTRYTFFTDDGVNGTPRTSSETRPINIYVHFIIKQ